MEHVQFRADASLIGSVEELADREDISKSEAWRSLAREGLAGIEAGDLDHLAVKEDIERIKTETWPEHQKAWFANQVGGKLLSDLNNALPPANASKTVSGYLKAARNHHGDEFEEYIFDALSMYVAAYEAGESTMLRDWIKDPSNKPVTDVAEDLPTDLAAELESASKALNGAGPDPDGGQVAATPTGTDTDDAADKELSRSYAEAVRDRAAWVTVHGQDIAEVSQPEDVDVPAETWVEDLKTFIDADEDDPALIDLEGGER